MLQKKNDISNIYNCISAITNIEAVEIFHSGIFMIYKSTVQELNHTCMSMQRRDSLAMLGVTHSVKVLLPSASMQIMELLSNAL